MDTQKKVTQFPHKSKNDLSLADALFTSTQQRVLAVLFGQVNRSYYLTEVVQLANIGTGSVQRELAKLEKSGLVNASKIGAQKHYQANEASPLFSELKSIVEKTVGLRQPLLDSLSSIEAKIKIAIVYGSVAKGTDTSNSDIDLVIVSDTLSLEKLYAVLLPLEGQLGRKVNPTVYRESEFSDKRNSGNSFLRKVLSQPIIELIGSIDE